MHICPLCQVGVLLLLLLLLPGTGSQRKGSPALLPKGWDGKTPSSRTRMMDPRGGMGWGLALLGAGSTGKHKVPSRICSSFDLRDLLSPPKALGTSSSQRTVRLETDLESGAFLSNSYSITHQSGSESALSSRLPLVLPQ